ncbi:hypothetical protein CLV47_101197 [Antricoccus suffuscus]|uniref:Uncharacterized protein n=2 Tax=Antricoccus suffuscus TaxID=1629062 RepID=A0A2T1A634_9ACTN|nr:hypothetical protein CLV47_101197 [Antricoccus suffuscus]
MLNSYFTHEPAGWSIDPLDYQYAGGEIPTLDVPGTTAVQWIRSDQRDARRRDGQADRDGDAEL